MRVNEDNWIGIQAEGSGQDRREGANEETGGNEEDE